MIKELKIALLLCCLFSLPVNGQVNAGLISAGETNQSGKGLNLFRSDEIMDITLSFDITTFRRVRSDTAELDAELIYHKSETDSIRKEVKIRARGVLRKQICEMPPIRLNFKKSSDPDDIFFNVDKLKVVTYCKSSNRESVLREYLVYRLFNQFSDISFRTRLARITYVNTSRNDKSFTEYAFFIEPVESLCKRTNSVEVTSMNLTQSKIRPDMMDRLAIFNYMIGNTDWSVPIHHNIVILANPESVRADLGMILPYDFDQAGLVGTSYAAPFEGLGISSVLERRYLGMCRSEEDFSRALAEFSEKKDDLYKLINDFPYLREPVRKSMINYMEGFFRQIINPKALLNKLRQECIRL